MDSQTIHIIYSQSSEGVFYAPTLFIPHVAWSTWSVCLAPPKPHHWPTGTPGGRKGNGTPSKLGYFSAKTGKNAYLQLVLQCQIWDRFFPLDLDISGFCDDKEKVFPLEALGKNFWGLLVHLFYAFQCDDGHLLIKLSLKQVWAFCV
jgi:hypothetical protein